MAKTDLALWSLALSLGGILAFMPPPTVALYAMVVGEPGDVRFLGPWDRRYPTDRYYTRTGCLKGVQAIAAVENVSGRTVSWFDCVPTTKTPAGDVTHGPGRQATSATTQR